MRDHVRKLDNDLRGRAKNGSGRTEICCSLGLVEASKHTNSVNRGLLCIDKAKLCMIQLS